MVQWIRIHLPMQGNRFDPWSEKRPRTAGQAQLVPQPTLSPEPAAARALQQEPARAETQTNYARHKKTRVPQRSLQHYS